MATAVKRKWTRGRLLALGVVIAAVAVSALLVGIGLGYLVLPGQSKNVVVAGASRWIAQGTTSSGRLWFGPSLVSFNATNGFPLTVPVGGSFSLVVQISNFDNQTHTIYFATANSPFTILSISPGLPNAIPASVDDASFVVDLGVGGSAGTYDLNLTLNALAPES